MRLKLSTIISLLFLSTFLASYSLAVPNIAKPKTVKTFRKSIDYYPVTILSYTRNMDNQLCPVSGPFISSTPQPAFVNPTVIPAGDVYGPDLSSDSNTATPAYITCYIEVAFNLNAGKLDLQTAKKIWGKQISVVPTTPLTCPTGLGIAGDKCLVGEGDAAFAASSGRVPDTSICFDDSALKNFFGPRTGAWWNTISRTEPEINHPDWTSSVAFTTYYRGYAENTTISKFHLLNTSLESGIDIPACPGRAFLKLGTTSLTAELVYKKQITAFYFLNYPYDPVNFAQTAMNNCNACSTCACRYLKEIYWPTTTSNITIQPGKHNVIKIPAPGPTTYLNVNPLPLPPGRAYYKFSDCCDLKNASDATLAAPVVEATPYTQ